MRRDFQPAVYIMASHRNGTLYVGATSDLVQRAWQHREGLGEGFTRRYGCKLLVWYELHATMEYAIAREKQIKGGSRKRKLAIIEGFNPVGRTCSRVSATNHVIIASEAKQSRAALTTPWIASSLRSSQ